MKSCKAIFALLTIVADVFLVYSVAFSTLTPYATDRGIKPSLLGFIYSMWSWPGIFLPYFVYRIDRRWGYYRPILFCLILLNIGALVFATMQYFSNVLAITVLAFIGRFI